MLVTIQNMMLLFSPGKRCPCPCSDAVLRSCEEALAGIILHRPPSLWFAWVRSGCPEARGPRIPWGGGGRVPHFTTRIPSLQPESLLPTHKLFRNPHFATGCEGFLTSLYTDNVKAWNLQHHPLQQPCRLESNAGCNVGVLKPKCMCVYIYI